MTHDIAVHDWSLDRTLGRFRSDSPDAVAADSLALVNLPAALRAHDISVVQFCHFHLPRRDPGYLHDLRDALSESAVRLDTFLVDADNLTHPGTGAADELWVAAQVRDAVALGAERVRVIAGKTRTPDAHASSTAALARLAAQNPEIRVVTENWFDVTSTADDVIRILEPLDDAVGLLIDLGNWTGADKYAELARITRFAETCHAKAHWHGAVMDETDYRRSISTVLEAGYDGPFALVYDGENDDEWAGLAAQRSVVESELA
ncbi:sugar phosphate isomerase [Frondihabitans sucicola]|uniref:Sugar phosphate isomerase n=1 Tax=Frondihabitans sucicola TaxID=1268041 RepID=A0ABN6Y138_9MICO|nr:TIM barrel protein [Frondihabitans sucicola]BDZ49590.1 sugar phosphate isomerase [Frondihabitans sucicola]